MRNEKDLAKRRQARMKAVFDDLHQIEDGIAAKGWPHYDVDPDLCMARYLEYANARDAYFAARGSTWDTWRMVCGDLT